MSASVVNLRLVTRTTRPFVRSLILMLTLVAPYYCQMRNKPSTFMATSLDTAILLMSLLASGCLHIVQDHLVAVGIHSTGDRPSIVNSSVEYHTGCSPIRDIQILISELAAVIRSSNGVHLHCTWKDFR